MRVSTAWARRLSTAVNRSGWFSKRPTTSSTRAFSVASSSCRECLAMTVQGSGFRRRSQDERPPRQSRVADIPLLRLLSGASRKSSQSMPAVDRSMDSIAAAMSCSAVSIFVSGNTCLQASSTGRGSKRRPRPTTQSSILFFRKYPPVPNSCSGACGRRRGCC